MIRIKVYKLRQLICAAVIALLVVAAVITGICLFARGNAEETQETLSYAAVSEQAGAAGGDKPSSDAAPAPLRLLDDPSRLLTAPLSSRRCKRVRVVDRLQPVRRAMYSAASRPVRGACSHRHSITCHSAWVRSMRDCSMACTSFLSTSVNKA